MTARIIVFGNEKGGSGKSTNCMHVAIALARMGFRLGALDLDIRQRSFSRYCENRLSYTQHKELKLPTPEIVELPKLLLDESMSDDPTYDQQFLSTIDAIRQRFDFIVIDCPGSHTQLSQLAHSLADTLVTPLNDSFIDFDLLARIDPESRKVLGPSVYSEMVWKARQRRSQEGLNPIDWIVVRNRVATQRMHNKKKISDAVDDLAKRIGFRVAPGFSERVIFRELFPRGLTLLDLRDIGVKSLNISNIAARQEVRELIKALKLDGVSVNF